MARHHATYLIFVLLGVLLLPAYQGYGQTATAKGNKLFDRNLFLDAIPYYQEDATIGDKETKIAALSKLADCYRITGQFELAEKTYKELLKKNKKDPSNFLKYAHSLKSSAKYSEAKEQYKIYTKMNTGDKMGPIYVQSCDSAQKWLDQTIGQEAKNLEKVNSKEPDFAPVFYKDGFVFSSSMEGSKKRWISFNGGTEVTKLDLYFEPINGGGLNSLVKPKNLTALNTPNHEGPATFTVTGDTVYFTKTVSGKKDKKTNKVLNSLQVFVSYKNAKGKWSKPVSAFNFNSTLYSVGHPSITKDGKQIYYMSDMPGGRGATDIYYSNKGIDGSWGPPINVGSEVNTFGHELFPFIADNGKLYFSSDVHPGMGSLDIFSAELEDGKWTNVQNLKPPINSISDDFGISFDHTCKIALFSSDRFNGKGADDIYAYIVNAPLDLKINGGNIEFPDFSSFDGIAYKIIDVASQQETILQPNSGTFSFTPEEGKKYTLSARKDGLSYNKINIEVKRGTDEHYLKYQIQSKSRPITVNGVLLNKEKKDSAGTEARIPGAIVQLLDSTGILSKTVCNSKGAYKFDKTLQPETKYTVLSSKKGNPPTSPKITCKGSVSGDGKALKNAELKLYVKDELVDQLKTNDDGTYKFLMDPNVDYKIVANQEGFIENKVLVSTAGLTSDNVLVRKIVLNPGERIDYTGAILDGDKPIPNAQLVLLKDNVPVQKTTTGPDGKFSFELMPDKNYTVSTVSQGFFQQSMDISTKGKTSSDFMTGSVKLDSIKMDKTINMPNIYYDYNSAEIHANSFPELDKLVDFMLVNPDVVIELASHTDVRGDAQYNMKLSQERADNVKNYLILSDVLGPRIITKGYGATKLIVKNAKTEAEHQVNRRTEFKVVKRISKTP